MPELPEVETIRRGLKPYILNKKIVQVVVEPGKCFRGEVSQIEGATIMEIGRRGKALLIELSNGYTMMVHLRMTGQLIWRGSLSRAIAASEVVAAPLPYHKYGSVRCLPLPGTSYELTSPQNSPRTSSPMTSPQNLPCTSSQLTSPQELSSSKDVFAGGHPSSNFTAELPNKQTRVTFVFNDGKLFFNDQRKFGFVKLMPTKDIEQDSFISSLAKEPWEMSVQELYEKCQRHGKAPIKAVLLDQKIIAGLGNIYADESLFYAKVHPTRLAGSLTEDEVSLVLEGAKKVMEASIDSGGSTMATYIRPDGTTGDYLEKFAQVFRREGKECPRCGAVIEKMKCAGRGTHYCPTCQKLPGEASRRLK